MIVFLSIVLLSLAGRSFCQAANATSHLKKPLIYQIGNVVRINADGERPLLRALDALQEKYGWVVDYEDPRHPADADGAGNADALPSRRHAGARNSRREALSVEFTVGPASDSFPDENTVLTTVVNAYNEGNAVMQFELRNGSDNQNGGQQERRFDVLGIIVSDHQNETQNQRPILDAPITVTKRPRTAEQTLALICQQVSERSKIPVTVGAIDGTVGGSREVAIGGVEVLARTLLSITLASMGDHLSWRLLYDSASKSYELSVNGPPQ
jgi:hypothetical protein